MAGLTSPAQFDAKARAMLAAGFDPGPAIGPVESAGIGEFRRYQHAVIMSHPVAGLHEVHGLIMERYFNRMGGPSCFLGYPATDETVAGVGRFNRFEFQGSGIFWHPVFGVREVHGLIGEYYWSVLGGPTGAWGFPVSDEYPDGSADRASDFEAGTLHWSPASGVIEILAPSPGAVVPAAGDWPRTGANDRLRYAVGQLVERYGFPPNGAAGVVGNLWAESAVIPSRIEGSSAASPMRAANFTGTVTDFTADQIMLRTNPGGPRLPGVGLAQWTSSARRAGMFAHVYNGVAFGSNALFSMDSQIDYLVTELRMRFPGVFSVVNDPNVAVDRASDEVVYNFEVPGAILEAGQKLPRADARVQAVFNQRRTPSRNARAAYAP
ncbi:phage tail tip lysozyme [Streptosporangium sandarakinum]|uniref:Phage tail lysozyme domain-containing protein n=1 Tax=Streptosporangium sandarakinum TaxID=1260955 RepID=A0A852UWW5_9ACTN|nr:phage tail tip lysozyme [Streptosporangium sandarakinum]NYF38221.1 hypothetical protein [Streptosporangium sandarakinum]